MRVKIAFIVLFSLTACDRPHRPPPIPKSDVDPTAFVGTPKEAAARRQEAQVLAAHPGLAERKGTTLTIHYRGHDLVSYTDDAHGCARYFVERAVRVFDPDSGRLEALALVDCHFGTTTNRYLVLPSTGKYALTDDVAASPDGHHLATSDSTVTPARGQFIIVEWPDFDRRAAFPAGCRNIQWQDDRHLTADCWHSDHPNTLNPYESDAMVFRARIWNDQGQWRMQATQWLHAESFAPLVSTKPLPTFTAVVKQGVDAPE
ncbi:MAG TPA: hypothetical protein VG839_02035 [Asticcacaulis sp.]|nr:hypothetical protein [Asticcacaulis sp.]